MLSPAAIEAAAEGATVVGTLHNYRMMCLPGTLLRDGSICEVCVGRVPWRGVAYRCYRGSVSAGAALATSITLHRALKTFDSVTLYLAISEFVRVKHIEAGFAPDRIAVKPHFAWKAIRRQGPGRYFLYIGRIASEKGIDGIARAWADAPAELLVAGDGPQLRRLRSEAPANVRFLGTLPPADIQRLLCDARALLVPSVCYEGAGKVVLEAYAAGVPVLASRIGALPEAVEDGKSGLLLPESDSTSWLAAAHSLMDDAEAERMGEEAWRLWDRLYRPELASRNLLEAYQVALRSGSQAGSRKS
jgi:glycosyltransferase involved in cell wall biosynthesis